MPAVSCDNSTCRRNRVIRGAWQHMLQARRIVMWLILMVLTALVSYAGFRGYLSPEMLINFANSFYC